MNTKVTEIKKENKCIPVKQSDTTKKQNKLTKNSMKEIWEKLKQLRTNLRHNNVSDKSCVFGILVNLIVHQYIYQKN